MDKAAILITHSIALSSAIMAITMANKIVDRETNTILSYVVKWLRTLIVALGLGIFINTIDDLIFIGKGIEIKNFAVLTCPLMELISNYPFVFSSYCHVGLSVVLYYEIDPFKNWKIMYSRSRRWIYLFLFVIFIGSTFSKFLRKRILNNQCVWYSSADQMVNFLIEFVYWYISPVIVISIFILKLLFTRKTLDHNIDFSKGDFQVSSRIKRIYFSRICYTIVILDVYWIIVNTFYQSFLIRNIFKNNYSSNLHRIRILKCPLYFEVVLFCFIWPLLYKYYGKHRPKYEEPNIAAERQLTNLMPEIDMETNSDFTTISHLRPQTVLSPVGKHNKPAPTIFIKPDNTDYDTVLTPHNSIKSSVTYTEQMNVAPMKVRQMKSKTTSSKKRNANVNKKFKNQSSKHYCIKCGRPLTKTESPKHLQTAVDGGDRLSRKSSSKKKIKTNSDGSTISSAKKKRIIEKIYQRKQKFNESIKNPKPDPSVTPVSMESPLGSQERLSRQSSPKKTSLTNSEISTINSDSRAKIAENKITQAEPPHKPFGIINEPKSKAISSSRSAETAISARDKSRRFPCLRKKSESSSADSPVNSPPSTRKAKNVKKSRKPSSRQSDESSKRKKLIKKKSPVFTGSGSGSSKKIVRNSASKKKSLTNSEVSSTSSRTKVKPKKKKRVPKRYSPDEIVKKWKLTRRKSPRSARSGSSSRSRLSRNSTPKKTSLTNSDVSTANYGSRNKTLHSKRTQSYHKSDKTINKWKSTKTLSPSSAESGSSSRSKFSQSPSSKKKSPTNSDVSTKKSYKTNKSEKRMQKKSPSNHNSDEISNKRIPAKKNNQHSTNSKKLSPKNKNKLSINIIEVCD